MPVETLSNTIMGCCVTPVSDDHGDKYGVPSLEELGELIEIKSFICQVSGEFQFSQVSLEWWFKMNFKIKISNILETILKRNTLDLNDTITVSIYCDLTHIHEFHKLQHENPSGYARLVLVLLTYIILIQDLTLRDYLLLSGQVVKRRH